MRLFNKVFFIRSAMVLFWGAVFMLFLFVPGMTHFVHHERSLNIFTWPMLLDAQYLNKFEVETGIKLKISYYENNEELLSKLAATQGQGYDLIIPSDYIVESLIQLNLVKKLDRSKIEIFPDIDPVLLGRYFDPYNDYSIPYYWAYFGLGYDKQAFGDQVPPATWGLIFDERLAPRRITVSESPREGLLTAALYLYGTIEGVFDDPEKIKSIKNLLVKQKKWVEVYTEARATELLFSKSVGTVFVLSSEVQRIMPYTDSIDFVVPQEGTFLLLDSVMVSAASDKDDLVYQFINYLFKPDILKHNFLKFGSFPPVRAIFDNILATTGIRHIAIPTTRQVKNFDLLRNVIPDKVMNDLWIEVMGS